MGKKIVAALFVAFIIVLPSFSQPYHQYIDPFIGSEGEGHIFIGPSVPFGMVKPGPDNNKYSNSGYVSDSLVPIFGFSQIHVSGTGGGAKYGNISLMPYTGQFDMYDEGSIFCDERAETSYYGVKLKKWNIDVELTTTAKASFHRYVFSLGKKGVKVDAGAFLDEGNLPDSREAQHLVGSEIEIVSDYAVRGYNRVRGGWNNGTAYTVYFYAEFDQPFESFGTWKGNDVFKSVESQADTGEKTGAYMSFGENSSDTVQVKIGISFLSSLKAKQNLESEISHWNFDRVLNEGQNLWEEMISRIEIDESATYEQKVMFYTGLYHTMLMPVDRTGENPLWLSPKPYYDDFYALWDTYRTSHPLLTLITPSRQADIVNCLIDIYKFEGYMPDARSGNYNGRTQGGSNADVLIADAFVKGLPGVNYGTGLHAMLKNANIPPGGNEEKEGRGGLTDYNSLGYVSTRFVRAGNRTLEYALNDYCIAAVAKGLGRNGEYRRFLKQSDNWKNLWRDIEHEGSRGFIMPKDAAGNWVDSIQCDRKDGRVSYVQYDPLAQEWPICVCWWCGFFYEGTSWEYSLFVPHDVPGLIDQCGGSNAFQKRLDTFFENSYYNVANEPSFLSPCLYHWIGRPELSSKRVHQIIDDNYNISRSGIPGNDDSGSMSSWLAFHMMGFYPNAGHSYYLLNTPYFKETVIHQENGNDFIIRAENLSENNCYIQSAILNGKSYNKAWIEHNNIVAGGELIFIMGSKPSSWGHEIMPPQDIK
ncbi:MAG: GH92 family glycosyl hydrolase [Prolixibacteraceae bacterium]|jgi:predicted alpha-1,2-mannosidase|nr:GH92 family glycosyl hydrolase [Prolixibacteraceae bacterium]